MSHLSSKSDYLLDNQQIEAGTRFDALSTLFNPSTFRHMRDLGIQQGWRCWEVGAGGPSVPLWLVEQVGTEGRVLATDIDVSWIQEDSAFEVRHQDVAQDEPPAETFDLVHARLVLVHIANREKALQAMMRVLRPGGWLFVEDADPALQPLICIDEYSAAQQLANKLRFGFRKLLAQRSADLSFGRKLPRLLRELGLKNVNADAFFPITSSACNLLETATINQVREALIANDYANAEEIELHLANVASGQLDLATSPMISAWGRRL